MRLFCALALILSISHSLASDLLIQTDSGTVSGWEGVSRDGRTYQAWTGIPFAEPPIGRLRFKAPLPKTVWKGVLNATVDRMMCYQMSEIGGYGGYEDCLNLNVYRPKINKDNMPVLVYIHGSHYDFQSGDMGFRTNANYLMDEDVVLVKIHYRLGPFGFMSLGDSVMPGNFGLKDQVLALKWVKRNIAAFGGNPNSVTLFGESAGGASAHILLKSPASDDLVHRAVSESGSINRFWSLRSSASVQSATLLLARKCGCFSRNSVNVLECMQKTNASSIFHAWASIIADRAKAYTPLFGPVIEPEDADEAVATVDLSLLPSKKPWITSICTGEWLAFMITMGTKWWDSDFPSFVKQIISAQPIEVTRTRLSGVSEILGQFYGPEANYSFSVQNSQAAKVDADMSYIYPALFNIATHKGPKWIYQLDHVSEAAEWSLDLLSIDLKVSYHGSQIASYLDLWQDIPMSPVGKPFDYDVSKRMIKYLVNFAYYDDPTPESSPFRWKQFNGKEILRITSRGDYFADDQLLEEMSDLYSLWDTLIGWKDKL